MILHWLIPLLLLAQTYSVVALRCIQCDMSSHWYAEEEHEHHIKACQLGQVEPTICNNRSHTHCIVSWYKNGINADRVVTERKCGTEQDVTGCTLYNAKINRKVRHLLNNERQPESRREAATFVEVCSESCPEGDCVNAASTQQPYFSLVLVLITGVLFR